MDDLIDTLEKKIRIHELARLLRDLGERPGGCVSSERMEGAANARHEIRVIIRQRIRTLRGE